MSPGRGDPIRLRLLWWAMTRFEKAAQLCRTLSIKWDKNRGARPPREGDRG